MPRPHPGLVPDAELVEPPRPGALVIGEGLRCAFGEVSAAPLPERLETLIGALGAACGPRPAGGGALRR